MELNHTREEPELDLYTRILSCWRNSRQVALYRRFSKSEPHWLTIGVRNADVDWRKTELFVYQPRYPLNQFSSRISQCTSSLLVVTGLVVYHDDQCAESYTLTCKRAPQGCSWYECEMEIETSLNPIYLRAYYDESRFSVPERSYCRFSINDVKTRPKMEQLILHNDTIGNFGGWLPDGRVLLKYFGGKSVSPRPEECYAIFDVSRSQERTVHDSELVEASIMPLTTPDIDFIQHVISESIFGVKLKDHNQVSLDTTSVPKAPSGGISPNCFET